jgi:hypothetical protein
VYGIGSYCCSTDAGYAANQFSEGRGFRSSRKKIVQEKNRSVMMIIRKKVPSTTNRRKKILRHVKTTDVTHMLHQHSNSRYTQLPFLVSSRQLQLTELTESVFRDANYITETTPKL